MTDESPRSVSVALSDLLNAFEFVSIGPQYDNEAYISIDTGRIYFASQSSDSDPDLPEDIGDSDNYIAIPHKNDLDLGRNLVFSFVARERPDDYDSVVDMFRRKGAYRRFHGFLDAHDLRDKWYAFQASSTEEALREWCEMNGIQLT